jgi:DNA (cytosine-5)-methyltransferase 1|tara:strand:- start:2550 stop:3590 length:1041 start_codon:yes stop_codon:yes gene_type:complete
MFNLSLFSGAGGMDIGLHKAGFITKQYVESDEKCRDTLRANLTNPLLFTDVKIYKGQKGIFDLVSGGPPCQSFSTAGKREALEDPRGSLIFDFIRIISETMPRFFVMENVRGLESASLPDKPMGSVLQEEVYPRFTALGYELATGLVSSLDYGIAQDRKRFLIVGSRDHEFGTWPEKLPILKLLPPTHGPGTINQYKVLCEVLTDLPDERMESLAYSDARAKIYSEIPPGGNWRYFRDSPKYPSEYVQEVLGGAYNSTGGRVGFWRRLSWEKWSPTLTTSPVQKATGLCHPDETRPLSVREYARIQGFPDNWDFKGTTAAKYRQIGNAVPIVLGKVIGQTLSKYME